ncbi:MAG: hypothetical protein IT238_03785 [Bacteroidia bacterium]|nr:hypothetical protein [Bacteroidia bacterium]MCZ2249550.1 hypothetical protein [Bacteroidia bacterium]
MKNVNATIIFILSVLFCTGINAQNPEKKKQRIASQKIAFLTKELDLTEAESKSFWPVYNEYENKVEQLRKEKKANRKNIIIENLSDSEAETFIETESNFGVNMANLDKQYYAKFKQVLPVKKVAKLIKAEDDFKRYLLKQIKDSPK